MAKTGIRAILIQNEAMGKQKIKRLVNLRKSNRVMGTNDNYENKKIFLVLRGERKLGQAS